MKKLTLLTVILLLTIILSGCGKNDEADIDGQSNLEAGSSEFSNQQGGEAGEKVADNGGGLVDNLKNAISSGKKMKCTYKMANEDGETEVITYLQGDKYKTEINMGQMKTMSIFDGEAMYSWVSGQKVGTKMTMDCINSLDTKGEIAAEDVPEVSGEDEDSFMETLTDAQNLSCEDAQDVDFDIPGDVNFSDQCEMLKSQQQMIEGLNN